MRKRKWPAFVFMTGFLTCIFPFVFNIKAARSHADAISGFDKRARELDDRFLRMQNEAKEYNDMLFQSQGALVDNMQAGILSEENYKKLLDVSGNGIMGSLEIPKINVNLPIYHGTGQEALSGGVGHLKGTSLPLGGENTHCVLTGHRGLPSARLLVRLDEIKSGDLLYLNVGNDTLAYKVSDLRTIKPEDVSCLKINPGKDRLSVVTCTPYGINTKRLVVTGDRVKYEKAEFDKIRVGMPSLREILFFAAPFAFLAVYAGMSIKDRRHKYYGEKRY